MGALAEAVDELLVDDVDRELARDLAGGRAAHAVAHAEHARRWCPPPCARSRLEQAAGLTCEIGDEEVVLVVLADLADVGAPEQLHADFAHLGGNDHRV